MTSFERRDQCGPHIPKYAPFTKHHGINISIVYIIDVSLWITEISCICFEAIPQLLLLDIFWVLNISSKDNNIIISFAKAEDNIGQ